MKATTNYLKAIITVLSLFFVAAMHAQNGVGINTTTPVSTLDVNGSIGTKLNTITANTTLDDTYSNVVCNNAGAITITLPLANTCLGRVYNIKKVNAGNVTIARSGTNTIDGGTSWLLDDPYEVVMVVSDGSSSWAVMSQITPVTKTTTAGGAWNQGGNALTSEKTLGLTSNYALPFITNNAERMRISAAGNVGIGHNSPGTIFDIVDPSSSNPTVLRLRTSRALNPASPDRVNTIEFNENSSAGNYGFTLDHYDGAGVGKQTLRISHLNSTLREDMLTFTEQLNVGVGSAPSFDATYPEKFLVAAGTTTSVNAIKATGSINNYFQLNIQNTSTGASASSDIVATANDGTETNYFVDMGINGSGYSSPSFTIGDAHDGYLYSLGDDFAIGNAATGRDLKFFTNGTLAANERMRVTSAGNVGIGVTAPEQPLHVVKNTVGTGPTRDDVVSDGAEYKSLNYQYLTALLAEGMKEQQKQIEELKLQNATMRIKNKAMENKLEGLLKQVIQLNESKITTAKAEE